jgi:PIN domain nuclease of toxin-antitoxin system
MASPLNLLLDTHVLLWWLGANSRLSQAARNAIGAGGAVYVSAVSAWEIAIKTSQGKLDFPGNLEEQLLHNRFESLPVSVSHALAVATLPFHHRDPFDRLLIAQARMESLTLLTGDERLKAYDAPVLLV